MYHISVVRRYAELAENIQQGNSEAAVLQVNGGHKFILDKIKVTFCITNTSPGVVQKCLYVSIDTDDDWVPGRDLAYTLAHHFGFYGSVLSETGLVHECEPTWDVLFDRPNHSVLVTQNIIDIN